MKIELNKLVKAMEMLIDESGNDETRQSDVNNNSIYQEYIGKYVIVRSRNEGVNAGIVVRANKDGVSLTNVRRLHYHKPRNGSWYEGVAKTGLADGCRVSCEAGKLIVEDYSLTICTEEAQVSIEGYSEHKG